MLVELYPASIELSSQEGRIWHFSGLLTVTLLLIYTIPMQEHDLTLEELAEQAGVTVRTIRFYITEGLLTGPGGRGKAASYGEDHLLRLKLIRLLSDQHTPLAEIRALLAPLSLVEIRALLTEQEQHVVEQMRAQQAPTPKTYIESLLKQARQVKEQREEPYPDALQAPAPSPIPPAPSSPEFGETEESSWLRWVVAPGLELHVQSHLRARYQRLMRHVLRLAQDENAEGP